MIGLRLVLLGLSLEALYLVFFILPFDLLTWLPTPTQDLGKITGFGVEGAVRYLVGVGALMLLSWLAIRESLRLPAGAAARIGLAFAALFAFTLLWIYPIDALDVFDYAMHGRILAVHGGNPYSDLPLIFSGDPFLDFAAWRQYPTVYGPLWTYLEGLVALLAGNSLLAAILGFKLLAALASLGCSLLAYRIVRRWQPERAGAAVLLIGWNPLVVLMVGTGHNDIVMMVFVLAGIWITTRGARALGLWVVGLSTLVKLATAPIWPVLALGQWAELRRRPVRGLLLVLLSGLAVAVATLALYLPLWPGLEMFGPLLRQDLFTFSPLGLVRQLLIPQLGEREATEWAVRLGNGLLVLFTLAALWRARRGERASVRAAHDALFWIVFLALTWWQPWYLIWTACLAALDERPWVPALSWVAGLAALVGLFDRFYLTFSWLPLDMLRHHYHSLLLVYLLPVAFALLAPWVWPRRVGSGGAGDPSTGSG